jgi:translation initiation factor 2B subunit (eIF-2B alpha/beta/delta family)
LFLAGKLLSNQNHLVLVAMAKRLKNNAQLHDYVKAVKSCLSKWNYHYLQTNNDDVVGSYFDFLEELLSKTQRPGKELLLQALKKVHAEVEVQEISNFVDRILSVCLYLRAAARTSTSCKKLCPKIRPLVQLLKKQGSQLELSPSPDAERVISIPSSSSTSISRATRSDIFESYGLQMPSSSRASFAEIEEIVDSPCEMPGHMEWFDSESNAFKRKLKDNTIVEACLKQGPKGFVMASFPGEEAKEIEVPNLVLLPVEVKKRPASAKAKAAQKKPAAKVTEDVNVTEDSSGDEVVVPEAELPTSTTFFQYSQPYRYPTGVYAVRRATKYDKKQICSAKCKTMPEAELYTVMQELSKLLNSGKVAESDAYAWLKPKVY